MKENTSVLKSEYIIDGIRMDATPEAMLERASDRESPEDQSTEPSFAPVIDESVDPSPSADDFSPDGIQEYLAGILALEKRSSPLCYSSSYTKQIIAGALIDAIWKGGHFRLGDLAVSVRWSINDGKVGNMAAFYSSVEAACSYLEDLGVRIDEYRVDEGKCWIEAKAFLSDKPAPAENQTPVFGSKASEGGVEDFFAELPFQTEHPTMRHSRRCEETASSDEHSWIIYIPFDPGPLLLGGSALSDAIGKPCGKAPEIDSPDYFIDCYEVVRELIEDGIVRGGTSVGEGGLLTALRKFIPRNLGMTAEVGGIMKSYKESDIVKVLFSEIPGVIVEIPDDDYDYIDAELLLQDVAYYPLGHINRNTEGISTSTADNSDITQILESLLNGQVSEGED